MIAAGDAMVFGDGKREADDTTENTVPETKKPKKENQHGMEIS